MEQVAKTPNSPPKVINNIKFMIVGGDIFNVIFRQKNQVGKAGNGEMVLFKIGLTHPSQVLPPHSRRLVIGIVPLA